MKRFPIYLYRLPFLYSLVDTGGSYDGTAGRPRYCVHHIGMTLVAKGIAPVGEIPELHGFIVAAGGDSLAIKRPRHSVQHVSMAAIRKEQLTCSCLPDLYRFIGTGGCYVRAIGRPRHSSHGIGMAAIAEDVATVDGFPQAHGLIVTAGGNHSLIGRPNQHIFRLDIPVNDFFIMGILQSIGYLLQIRENNGRSDNGVSRMALSQRAIGGIVQHQEGSVLQHVKIKDADNMRMP